MLSDAQIERYARHILLREVGGVGQERLLAASVRIEGLGQVGSWAVLYLALAGVGRISLADGRPVPELGLAPLLDAGAAGEGREEALARALEAHNPDVRFSVGAGKPREGDADESFLSAAEEGPRLWARASGARIGLGWVEAQPPCARCFPADAPRPETAALAGSLAASRLLSHLLFGESEPGLLGIEDGREEVIAPCPHR